MINKKQKMLSRIRTAFLYVRSDPPLFYLMSIINPVRMIKNAKLNSEKVPT